MFRNEHFSGPPSEDSTMTRSDYQLWCPSEMANSDVGDIQYFNTDGTLFEGGDALEYNENLLKCIDIECKEPFNADDIIDSCMNQSLERNEEFDSANVSREGSDDGRQIQIELPGDPTSVLQSLSTMLDGTGGVDSKDNTFVKIMESSHLMPVRCIIINILRATNKITLKRLLSDGVWPILHKWLLEARSQNNVPLMMEILQLCKLMPISTKLLKSNSFAKDIKQMTKNTDERVSRLAKVIVEEWVRLVTGVKSNNSDASNTFGRARNRKTEPMKMIQQESESSKVEVPASAAAAAVVEAAVKSPPEKPDSAEEIKEKPRPKTVKALPIKFRSTGLEYVETDKNAAKQVKQAVEKIPSQKAINGSTSVSNFLSKPITPREQTAKPSKIKLIPARPLQPELSEKSAFLDALKSSSGPIRRKRKVPTSPTPKTTLATTTTTTTITTDFNKDEIAAALRTAAQGPSFTEQENPPNGDDGEEVPTKRTKNKKTVSWPSDNDLCDFFYFDVDPEERVNVNKIQSSSDFNDHRRHEIEMERRDIVNMCQSGKKGLSLVDWRCPPPIDGLEQTSSAPGCESKEKFTQKERENKVLQVIYFSQESMPDSPAEPDDEALRLGQEECRVIPLDDEEEPMEVDSGTAASNPSKLPTSLPPILTNLFGNLMNQSPNIETNATVSPLTDELESNNNPHSPFPLEDTRYNYNNNNNHPPNQVDPAINYNQPPRNEFNYPMQQFNQRDRFGYPDEPHNNNNNNNSNNNNNNNNRFRPRGHAPSFHQNDFRGRNSGPRHGGFSGQVCQFFMAGSCRFGTSCRNIHPR